MWLLGVVQAAFSLTGILRNPLVKRTMREGDRGASLPACWRSRPGSIGAAGLRDRRRGPGYSDAGLLPAGIAIALWLLFGFVFGIATAGPHGYINEHIPSAQRATVLSLDAFFADAGGTVGQPALGWISERLSIPVGWLIGGAFLATAPLFYRASGKAAREEGSSLS